MNREFKREADRQRQRDAERDRVGEAEAFAEAKKRKKSDVPAFVREVRSELRRVHWPSRKELASYSLVVLVFVALMTAYISVLDRGFATVIFQIFG